MTYTINKPLELNDDYVSQLDAHTKGEFVSKEIAVELLEALKKARNNIKDLGELFNSKSSYIEDCIAKYDLIITNAEK
jgi:dipeptidase